MSDTITITVNVDAAQFAASVTGGLEELIYDMAAEKLLNSLSLGSELQIEKKLGKTVIDRFESALVAVADKHIADIMAMPGGIAKEIGGKAPTVAEVAMARLSSFLDEKVNRDGRASSSDGYGAVGTRLHWLISQHLDHHFSAAINAALQEQKKKYIEAAKAKAAEAFANAVVK